MILTFDGIQIELISNMIGYVYPNPNWSIRPHAHPGVEIHIVSEGRGVTKVNKEELELCQNMIYMAPPGEIHAQWADRISPVGMYYINFNLHFLNPTNNWQVPRIHSPSSFASNKVETILGYNNHNPIGNRFNSNLRLIELIWEILEPTLPDSYLEEIRKLHAEKAPTDILAAPYYVEIVISYIQKHLLNHPTIEEIAAVCCLSTRHLSRLFLKTMGISIHQYLQNERFLWACNHLRHTDMKIQEISDKLNFCNSQYFSKWFKMAEHKSPMVYRRLHNKML